MAESEFEYLLRRLDTDNDEELVKRFFNEYEALKEESKEWKEKAKHNFDEFNKICVEVYKLERDNEALKEENELARQEIRKLSTRWLSEEKQRLHRQNNELVEMLDKVINNLTYPTEFLRKIRDEAEQLLNKIKEGNNE